MKFQAYLILFCFCLQMTGNVFAQKITSTKTAEGILVKEGMEDILFYQMKTKSHDGQYPRANYIHPLHGIDGVVLTEDFPEDHLHQRGIFWAWHQLNIGDQRIGDGWECKDFSWDVHLAGESNGKGKSHKLMMESFWKSPLWANDSGVQVPFLVEKSNITIYPEKKNYRVIDFEISLLALIKDLTIGGSEDSKGYGGFSVRMRMPEDVQFKSANGNIEPTNDPLQAGQWVDVSGSLSNKGTKAGIVMMNHINNPLQEAGWILRKRGSMQNPVFPGAEPFGISTTEPTVLKYRLVIYGDDLSPKKIQKIYNQKW